MHCKYRSDNLIVHTIAHKQAEFHLILVEDRVNLPDLTDQESQVSQLYHNLQADIGRWNQMPLQLTVISVTDAFVAKNAPFSTIVKLIDHLKFGFSPENEGIMLVSSLLAMKVVNKPYRFLNVVMPEPKSKLSKELSFEKSIDDGRPWMISVPSYLWSKVGHSVKGDGDGINLLGYIYRGCGALIEGQTEGSIASQMRAFHAGKFGETVFINTIDLFHKFMKELKFRDIASIDSETDNLQRINNTVLSLQFVLANGKPPIVDKTASSWFLPLEHADTPWSGKQLTYIRKTLRKHFESQCKNKLHVYQNAKFDFHQLIALLKLRNYAADIYDVSAGSFSLEENQKVLKAINVAAYSLEHMEQNMEYARPSDLVIGKADRSRMAEFSLEDICKYGVIDVYTPYFIMCEQVRIAEARGYPNFLKLITHQIGRMLHAMTIMEHNGIEVDMEYLESIASPMGPLADQIRSAVEKIKKTPEVAKANARILKENPNYQSRGLFGAITPPMVWDVRKVAHLQTLFFDVCNLEPIGYRKAKEGQVATGKLDARFQKTYRHHPIIKLYTEYQKLSKLKTAFADSIYEFLMENPDMMQDKRLRPFFTYLLVVSGRCSTVKPSTQQIPMHGENAKIIKRQFKVLIKRILGKTDYSAHEVRVSGNLSDDLAICETVDIINETILKFRVMVGSKEKIEAYGVQMESGADIHCLNYKTFFDVQITKKDPRRQDAKVAIFSVTYGAKAPAVARKMLEEALTSAENKLVAHSEAQLLLNSKVLLPDDVKAKHQKAILTEQEIKSVKKLVAYLKSDQAAEDYLEKAKDLLDVLEKKWNGLSGHIEELCAEVRVSHVLFGPQGRPRHLWGHASPDIYAGFAMDRRAFNSKSQGYASDIGFVSIYLFNQVKWNLFDSRGYKTDIMTVNAVHDSAMNDMAYRFFPIYAYMQEHAMTTLSEAYYKRHFGIKARSHYGFDMEAGIDEANLKAWNKRPADLPAFVEKLGHLTQVSDKEIKACMKDAEIMGQLRLDELNSNSKGYTMRLLDDGFWDKTVPRLQCFN